MSIRLSGLNPLSFIGVEALQPPEFVVEKRAPTTHDKNYNIGTFWLIDTTSLWMLISLSGGIATWVMLYPGGASVAITYNADSGSATPLAGILNVFGSSTINTSGAGNTLTITADPSLALEYIADDLTVATALNGLLGYVGNGVITTSGSGNTITVDLTNGTNGQTLIGGGTQATWANITSTGGSIAITNGANSINLEAVGLIEANQYTTDAGIATPNILDEIIIAGGSNINTSAAGNTVTTNLDNSVSISGQLATGTTLTAGTGLIVSAGGITSTGTTQLHSLTAGVMQTNGAGVVSSNNGTNGQVLIGGGAAPAWANITSTGGSVTITNGANSIDLSATGFVPPASRPSFSAYCPSNFSGSCASSVTFLQFGASPFPGFTEVFDQTGSFNPGDGAGTPCSFTAPRTGIYYLEAYLGVNIITATANAGIVDIRISTGANYRAVTRVPAARSPRTIGYSIIVQLSAGNVVTYFVSVVGTNTYLGDATNYVTWVSGYLIA